MAIYKPVPAKVLFGRLFGRTDTKFDWDTARKAREKRTCELAITRQGHFVRSSAPDRASRSPAPSVSRNYWAPLEVIWAPSEIRWPNPADMSSQPLAAQLRSILASSRRDVPQAARDNEAAFPTIGPGWVYILSNEAHPHFVKIGFSTDDPEVRAAEISSPTGVPLPFVLEFKIYIDECGGLEVAVHQKLNEVRVNPRREFFRISVIEAARCIAETAIELSDPLSKIIAYVRENGQLQIVNDAPGLDPWPSHRPSA